MGRVPLSGASAIPGAGQAGFYGRGELAAQLVRRLVRQLDRTGILLVAGESGAGKSSLLRAGLMPLLAAGALGPGSGRWPRQVIQPAGSPLRELAMQLADIAGADPVSVYQSLSAAPGEAPMLVEQAVRAAAVQRTQDRAHRPMPQLPRCRVWSWLLTSSRSCSPRAGTARPAGWSGRRSSRRCMRRPPFRPARTTRAGAGGCRGARGFPRPAHRLLAVKDRAGRRAVHGRADERG